MTMIWIVALVTFTASAALVAFLRTWTTRRRILDHPNERSLHARPMPRGGGIAIVVVTLAGILILERGVIAAILPYCIAALAMSVTGFIDDIRGLPTVMRLIIQALAALLALFAYGAFDGLSVPGSYVRFGPAAGVLMMMWIVGLTNAFNFMDGINGIAGGQAVVAGAAWAVIGAHRGDATLLHLGTLLAAGSLGFLIHNWTPTRIFMGDVGSTFLGYSFAVVGVVGAAVRRDALIAALIIWPFLFDSAFTFLRRLRMEENVFAAHRSHLYQRLTLSGWSHAQVASTYIVLAAIGAAGAVGIDRGLISATSVIVVVIACAAGLWLVTVRIETSARTRAAGRNGQSASPK